MLLRTAVFILATVALVTADYYGDDDGKCTGCYGTTSGYCQYPDGTCYGTNASTLEQLGMLAGVLPLHPHDRGVREK